MNLGWWLERAGWEYPDKTAVIDADGTSITYATLKALADRIGHVLRDEGGVAEDDIVLTCLPDSHLHVAILYAAMRIGAVFCGLSARQTPEKFHADIRRARPKVAIVAPEHGEIGALIASHPGIKVFVTGGNDPRFPNLLELASGKPDHLDIAPRRNDDIAVVNFTAGTSGASKGVIFTHGTLGTSAWGSIFQAGVTSATRNLSLVGMFHSGGIHDSIRLVMAGGTIIWSGGWDADRVVRILREHKPNFAYYIVTTMVRDLMRHPAWASLDLTGFKTHVAGETVPADIEQALRDKGARVGGLYGLTETMPVAALTSSLYYREEARVPPGSSGRPNKGFSELVLKDPFTGAVLDAPEAEGEICLRGDVVTPGYYNDPERTAAAFDADGYLHTRDLGWRDAEGWYYVRGRTDDMIMSGGEKLSLLEVDAALRHHPAVRDAACVGVAHARFGEVPAAFIVLETAMAEDAALTLLDDHCRRAMERWKRPRLYVFVDAVPRTAAKRTKMAGEMRRILDGITLAEADGITTLSRLRAAASRT